MTVFNNQHTKILQILIIGFLQASKNQLQHTTEETVHDYLPWLPKYHTNDIKDAKEKRSIEQHCDRQAAINELEFWGNLAWRTYQEIVLIIEHTNEESNQNVNEKMKQPRYRWIKVSAIYREQRQLCSSRNAQVFYLLHKACLPTSHPHTYIKDSLQFSQACISSEMTGLLRK